MRKVLLLGAAAVGLAVLTYMPMPYGGTEPVQRTSTETNMETENLRERIEALERQAAQTEAQSQSPATWAPWWTKINDPAYKAQEAQKYDLRRLEMKLYDLEKGLGSLYP